MGILDSISKNPSFLALAALGIGLFIFRDRISGFFSDITGGAQGTAQIASLGGTLATNLQSNLTQTPLPEDPLFGTSGFFTNLSKSISEFKFPSFELPSFPQPEGTGGDFTDVGMAEARARQQESTEIPIGERAGFDVIKELSNEGRITRDLIETPFAVSNVPETQVQFQERAGAFVEALPEVTAFTSLPGSFQGFGRQLSRESEDFESVLAAEARRSESIFAGLFGNVQNPDF